MQRGTFAHDAGVRPPKTVSKSGFISPVCFFVDVFAHQFLFFGDAGSNSQ
jgi:hypothetical protein